MVSTWYEVEVLDKEIDNTMVWICYVLVLTDRLILHLHVPQATTICLVPIVGVFDVNSPLLI